MLSEATGLPAVRLNGTERRFGRGDRVLYMGWVQNDRIKGYLRAASLYRVAGVCAVGLLPESEGIQYRLREKNGISDSRVKVFYLRGGLNLSKLSGVQRIMLGRVKRELRAAAAAGGREREEARSALEPLNAEEDFVTPEAVAPVIGFIQKCNRDAK